jgi:CheY-like chemotaxis protein
MARVLVVDDDPQTLSAMRKLLEYDGHTVACAADGTTAITLLRSQEFDAVFTDLDVPAPDGEAVARLARELLPAACVCICSASMRIEQRALAADACFFAPKPVDYDALQTRLEACRSCATCKSARRCHGRLHPQGYGT